MDKNNSIPVGSVDYYGKDACLRDYVLSCIESIYKKYGFEALYTPIIENEEVFKGHHGEGEKLLFKLQDKNGEKYVLKYDSTVPLARVVSMHNDIKLPYKRFQLQQSYRDDEVDKGHYREFIQCDGDIVGSYSPVADAEIIMIAHDGLEKLGFNDYTIRLNHRKLIQAIAYKANMTKKEDVIQIQRAIDYADKILKSGIQGIKSDLEKRNINEKVINIIIDLVKISDSNSNLEKILNDIKNYFSGIKTAEEGITELKQIINMLPQKVKNRCSIDFTLARGADYYTGFIIEAVINNINLGAVLGGGRYDDLLSAFSKKNIPAVGMAFGMERLIVAMKELNLDNLIYNDNKIVLYINENNDFEAVDLANKLRKKYNVSIISSKDVSEDCIEAYCKNSMAQFLCTLTSNKNIDIKEIDSTSNFNINQLYVDLDEYEDILKNTPRKKLLYD